MAPAHSRFSAPALSCHPASGFFARVTEAVRAPSSAIEVQRRARVGGRVIDPGLYRVRVDEARERIVLENDDRTYALTAFFRRSREISQFPTSASIEDGEEGRTFVVVRFANGCEWVA